MSLLLKKEGERDYRELSIKIVDWIRERVREAGCKGVVIGLSGGIDSSVCAALCREAFPKETLGLILPCHSHPRDKEDAELLARTIDLPYKVVDLGPTFDTLLSSLHKEEQESTIAVVNMKPRLRMTTLYYYAQSRRYLVAGTDNRTELLLGYFTKYGDGGIDFAPLGSLVKTEVIELAKEMGIPERIIEKPPSAGLWEGQEDEEELGLTYEEVDTYILTGQAPDHVKRRVEELAKKNQHKLQTPAIPSF